jgi:hypothetical protein
MKGVTMNHNLSRADEIAAAIIAKLQQDPRFLEKFKCQPAEAMVEGGFVLSTEEIQEIVKKLEERGYELPKLKTKGAWWLSFPWWKDSF